MNTRLLITSTVLFFALSMAPQATAQTPDLFLEITPPVNHIIAQPGKTIVHTLYIENKGQVNLDLTPTLRRFVSDNATGNPVILDEKFDLDFLKLQNSDVALDSSFQLPAGQKQQLIMEFQIPENIPPQEHHFILLFESRPQSNFTLNNNTAAVSGQIASTFIFSIVGEKLPSETLMIQEIIHSRFIDSFSSISPQIIVKNSGEFTSIARGTVTITAWGKQLHQFEILPTNILPDSSRSLTTFQTNQNNEIYSTPFVYKPLFLFGSYNVSVVLHTSSGDIVETRRIFAFPFIFCFVLVIGVFLTFLYTKTTLFSFDKARPH